MEVEEVSEESGPPPADDVGVRPPRPSPFARRLERIFSDYETFIEDFSRGFPGYTTGERVLGTVAGIGAVLGGVALAGLAAYAAVPAAGGGAAVGGTGGGAASLGSTGSGVAAFLGSVAFHLGLFSVGSEAEEVPLPNITLSPDELQEAQRRMLITEAREGLEAWRIDPHHDFNFADFLWNVDVQLGEPPLSREEGHRLAGQWAELIPSVSGSDPTSDAVEVLRQLFSRGGLSIETLGQPRLSGILCGEGGNCWARTQDIIAALSAAGVHFEEPQRLAVQHFDGHLQAVVYNRETGEVWDLFSGERTFEIRGPIYDAHLLLQAFLVGQGEDPPVSAEDLLLADRNVPLLEGESRGAPTVNFAFPLTEGVFSNDPNPPERVFFPTPQAYLRGGDPSTTSTTSESPSVVDFPFPFAPEGPPLRAGGYYNDPSLQAAFAGEEWERIDVRGVYAVRDPSARYDLLLPYGPPIVDFFNSLDSRGEQIRLLQVFLYERYSGAGDVDLRPNYLGELMNSERGSELLRFLENPQSEVDAAHLNRLTTFVAFLEDVSPSDCEDSPYLRPFFDRQETFLTWVHDYPETVLDHLNRLSQDARESFFGFIHSVNFYGATEEIAGPLLMAAIRSRVTDLAGEEIEEAVTEPESGVIAPGSPAPEGPDTAGWVWVDLDPPPPSLASETLMTVFRWTSSHMSFTWDPLNLALSELIRTHWRPEWSHLLHQYVERHPIGRRGGFSSFLLFIALSREVPPEQAVSQLRDMEDPLAGLEELHRTGRLPEDLIPLWQILADMPPSPRWEGSLPGPMLPIH